MARLPGIGSPARSFTLRPGSRCSRSRPENAGVVQDRHVIEGGPNGCSHGRRLWRHRRCVVGTRRPFPQLHAVGLGECRVHGTSWAQRRVDLPPNVADRHVSDMSPRSSSIPSTTDPRSPRTDRPWGACFWYGPSDLRGDATPRSALRSAPTRPTMPRVEGSQRRVIPPPVDHAQRGRVVRGDGVTDVASQLVDPAS
jgi:hypothetical protein